MAVIQEVIMTMGERPICRKVILRAILLFESFNELLKRIVESSRNHFAFVRKYSRMLIDQGYCLAVCCNFISFTFIGLE